MPGNYLQLERNTKNKKIDSLIGFSFKIQYLILP